MIRKYAVLLCLVTSVILIVIATFFYPGGSVLAKDSIGFGWSKNFLSNLYATKALNGSDNTGWIWAISGMAFHSAGYGLFFIHMSKKIPSKQLGIVLKIIGFTNIIFIFLIATPLHDLGTISIGLTLAGLFIITIFIFRSKLHLLKFCCILCLLTYYCFFLVFGLGNMGLAVILQKVYIVSSMLLVLALEHFTVPEHFIKKKPLVPSGSL